MLNNISSLLVFDWSNCIRAINVGTELINGIQWVNIPFVQVLGLEIFLIDVFHIKFRSSSTPELTAALSLPSFDKLSVPRFSTWYVLYVHVVLALQVSRPSIGIR